MPKLTLSIDRGVVERAKSAAEKRHTSLSRLVEQFLRLLSRREKPVTTPVLRELRGSLKGADVGDHRRHLEKKYR